MKFENWWDSIGGDNIYHNRIHNRPFMLKTFAEEIWGASQIHNDAPPNPSLESDGASDCGCAEAIFHKGYICKYCGKAIGYTPLLNSTLCFLEVNDDYK